MEIDGEKTLVVALCLAVVIASVWKKSRGEQGSSGRLKPGELQSSQSVFTRKDRRPPGKHEQWVWGPPLVVRGQIPVSPMHFTVEQPGFPARQGISEENSREGACQCRTGTLETNKRESLGKSKKEQKEPGNLRKWLARFFLTSNYHSRRGKLEDLSQSLPPKSSVTMISPQNEH